MCATNSLGNLPTGMGGVIGDALLHGTRNLVGISGTALGTALDNGDVKVLDGCGVNGMVWVFASGLTHLVAATGSVSEKAAQPARDALEIVVVDACSPEREGELVRAYQARHPRAAG